MRNLGPVLLLASVGVALAAAPRPQNDAPGALAAGDSAVATARAEAAALHPAFVLEHLCLFAHPTRLASLAMSGEETWTPAGGASTVDRSRVFYYKTVELELPATHNGRPVSARAQARARRAIARMQSNINAAWRGPASAGRLLQLDGQIVDLGSLLDRFVWRPVGISRYWGRPAVEYRFTPRAGLRSASRAERVMAAMEGNLWLDPESGQVLRVDFANRKPVRFGFGLLASFSDIRGRFEMQPQGDGWVWGSTIVHLRGRELWFDKSGTLVKRYLLAGGPAH